MDSSHYSFISVSFKVYLTFLCLRWEPNALLHRHPPLLPRRPPVQSLSKRSAYIIYSSTGEALEEFNKERETDTLAHWFDKEPPTLIGMSGQTGRYKLHFGKKRLFIVVGMVVEHDVNIKKEVPPHNPSQFLVLNSL